MTGRVLKSFVWTLIVGATALTSVFRPPSAVAVTIDFDNLPGMPNVIGPVPVASQLTNQLQPTTGAVFTSVGGYVSVVDAYNPDFGPNHTISDPNMIAGSREGGDLSYRSRVVISFFDPDYADVPAVTDSVSIRGDRFPFAGASALMEAYDVYGNFLSGSFMADSAAGLTLSINSPGIHKVRISQVAPGAMGEDGGIGLDNLEFNTVAPRYRGGFSQLLVSTTDGPNDGNGSFSSYFNVRLNDRGQAAFTAQLTDTTGGLTDDVGIYRADENFLVEIDREFFNPLLGNRKTIISLAGVAINNSGDVVYHATIDNPIAVVPIFDRQQVLRGDGGPRETLAFEDQAAPDGNGEFASFPDWMGNTLPSTHHVNNAGQVVIPAVLANTFGGGQDDQGIYRYSEGTLSVMDREFTGPVVHYTPHAPADMNGNGVVAYISTRGFNNPDGLTQISRANGVTVDNIAQTGDSVPNGFGLFRDFGAPKISGGDQVAFTATIDDGILGDSGVFRSNNDGPPLSELARAGQASPDGVSQFTQFGEVAINDFGLVAMEAHWATGTESGILVGNGNSLDPVVRTGQEAPDGVGEFGNVLSLIDMNSAGNVFFYARLSGPGVTSFNDEGLFLGNTDYLVQVAREGSLWSPELAITGFGPGDLNEVNQVAYTATLTERFGPGVENVVALYTPPVQPADLNEDGIVSASDYVHWRNHRGFSGFDFTGDHNNSGTIDAGDYAIWRHHFGQSLLNGSGAGEVAGAAVPEPGTLLLGGLACAGLLRRRRLLNSR